MGGERNGCLQQAQTECLSLTRAGQVDAADDAVGGGREEQLVVRAGLVIVLQRDVAGRGALLEVALLKDLWAGAADGIDTRGRRKGFNPCVVKRGETPS